MNEENKAKTIFLNVDLDLKARDGLDELLRYLEPFAVVLNRTEQEASLELRQGSDSLDQTLIKFADVIQGLPRPAKELWHRTELRRLNIGVQGGNEPHEAHFLVSDNTIDQIARIKSEIVFTVYASPGR